MFKPRPQTVIMTVGPSGCGKTYFCQRIMAAGRAAGLRMVYLSSDDLRREFLGKPDADAFGLEMRHASGAAFDTLHSMLDSAMKYPVNADYILVDTMGMSEEFRLKVAKQAHANMYEVVIALFNYKNREDFMRFVPQERQGRVWEMIGRFNRDVLPNLKRNTVDDIWRITKHDSADICLSNVGIERPSYNGPVLVVGDVHGCLAELKELVAQVKSEETTIVLAGDFIDKGPDSEGVIDWILANPNVVPVIGNHENFIYKHFAGKLKDIEPEAYENFPDIAKMGPKEKESWSEWTKKFMFVMESRAVPFFLGHNLIVTHAPCDMEYLGKVHKTAAKYQRNFRYTDMVKGLTVEETVPVLEKALSFLKEQAQNSHPFHVFGHIPTKEVYRMRNKYGIDTGCVDGGKLSGLIFPRVELMGWDSKPQVLSVSSKKAEKVKLPDLFLPAKRGVKTVENVEVTDYVRKRLRGLSGNKVNFISGTMSPCDRNLERGTLENVEEALAYYRNVGVETIVAQPKFMGSRANVYLTRDPETCYTITRNGFKVKDNAALILEYKRLIDLVYVSHKIELNSDNTGMFILDAELCPWNFLGEGLINGTFRAIGSGLSAEMRVLAETGFDEIATGVYEQLAKKCNDKGLTKKADIVDEFGHTIWSTLHALDTLRLPSREKRAEYLKTYEEQLRLYGAAGEPKFHPFAILKQVFKDGSEKVWIDPNESNLKMFTLLNPMPIMVAHTKGEESLKSVEQFFNEMTKEQNFEGLVFKPEQAYIKDVAPYVKVRNPRYLSIIYGYDYLEPRKYASLLEDKRIVRKMNLSISEYKLGMDMLKIPYASIDVSNDDYCRLAIALLGEIEKEAGLDERL